MASLYQRFSSGTIETNKSFPSPPETSHLLGQSAEGPRGPESHRARVQQHYRRQRDDEDVCDMACSSVPHSLYSVVWQVEQWSWCMNRA